MRLVFDLETKRVGMPFRTFVQICDPDTTVWWYEDEAEKIGLDPWHEITDWDVVAVPSSFDWWRNGVEQSQNSVVWVQAKDLQTT